MKPASTKRRTACLASGSSMKSWGVAADRKLTQWVSFQSAPTARPLGITLSDWDLLDHAKFNAPGKPKLAIEIEYARPEISRIFEERTLFDLETEGSETHGASSPKTDSKPHNPIGRPSTGPLGKLDRQLHTALYRKRDLAWNNRSRLSDNGTRGRPPLPIETRMARLDDVIATCRTLIKEAESALGVQDLQRRLIKRLKDAASRVRMSMRTLTGSALVLQKSLLEHLEAEITIESETLEQLRGRAFQGSISLTDLRAAIVEKTVAFDTNLYASTISPRAAAIF